MSDDLIYVEPRQEAIVQLDETSICCPTVPEAYIAWAQLELDEKERAVIQVGDDSYDIKSIRRLRYEQPVAEAA
jgi:hypothetical protein